MTKRILSLVAVLTLIMTMFMILPNTAFAYYYAYSNCNNGKPLNVRSGPGKDYPIIGTIPYREQVGVDHDLGNGWSELIWGSVPGYAMTSLMSKSDPGPYDPSRNQKKNETNPVPAETGLNAVFNKAKIVTPYLVTLKAARASGAANVRWAPSKASTLQKAYASGQQVEVIAELDQWYQVVDPVSGLTGFVNAAYVVK